MSNVKKIAIVLPADLASAITTAAKEDRTSILGGLVKAEERSLRRRSSIEALKDYELEFGEISKDEIED